MMEERITLNSDVTAPSILSVTQESRTFQSECKICGADAFSTYLGVVTCSACEIFFRRNAATKQVR
jgi:hypothetical protein